MEGSSENSNNEASNNSNSRHSSTYRPPVNMEQTCAQNYQWPNFRAKFGHHGTNFDQHHLNVQTNYEHNYGRQSHHGFHNEYMPYGNPYGTAGSNSTVSPSLSNTSNRCGSYPATFPISNSFHQKKNFLVKNPKRIFSPAPNPQSHSQQESSSPSVKDASTLSMESARDANKSPGNDMDRNNATTFIEEQVVVYNDPTVVVGQFQPQIIKALKDDTLTSRFKPTLKEMVHRRRLLLDLCNDRQNNFSGFVPHEDGKHRW